MKVRLTPLAVADPSTLVLALQELLKRVPEVYWFDVTFAAPFVPLSIYHRIGRVPDGFLQEPQIDTVVWAEPNDRLGWSTERAVVRCNAENAVVRVGLVVM